MNDNIVIIEGAYNKTPGQAYYIQPCKGPNGMYPECVRDVDNSGQMILSESDKEYLAKGGVLIPADKLIKIVHGKEFNLNNPREKAEWEAIKYSCFVAEDRHAKDKNGNPLVDGNKLEVSDTSAVYGKFGIADLYVKHPGAESKIKNDINRKKYEAKKYIYEDTIDGWITKCKLLEKDMSHSNVNDIEDYLINQAEKYPDKIIELYKGNTTATRLLIITALEKGTIVKRDGLIIYGDDIILGTSVDKAVQYLSDPDHKLIRQRIQNETFPELQKETSSEKEKKNK